MTQPASKRLLTEATAAATYLPIDGILSQERSHLLGVQAAEQRNLAPGCTIGAWSAANAASSIASSVDIDAILDPFGAGTVNPIFRYYGGHPAQRSSTSYPGQVVTKMTGLTADATELMPAIVFNHEGATAFEIRIFGQGSYQTRTRVAVDGAWINYTLLDGPAQDGNVYRRTITLPDTSKHEIRLEFSGFSAWFAGITVAPAAKVTRVLRNSGPRLIMVGDSETEGADGLPNVVGNKLGFAPEAARLMGVEDFWQSAIGDTGYVGTSGGTRPTIGQRLQADVLTQAPDWVHFTAGQVDGGLGTPPTYSTMLAAVGDVLDRTRTALPNAQITAQSPWRPFTGITAVASTIVVRNAIRDACATRGIPFYDVSQFITGTGHIGATAGDGNADIYVGPDGVHLSDAGHIAAGRYLAAMLRRTLSLPGVAG